MCVCIYIYIYIYLYTLHSYQHTLGPWCVYRSLGVECSPEHPQTGNALQEA